MKENELKIFTLAWSFPPMTSGESVICRRSLEYSQWEYDVCSGNTSDIFVTPKVIKNVHVYPEKGRYFTWSFRAARLFRKLDQQNDYKIMLSRVMPAAGHFAGLLVKCLKPKIKWIVYFSDPVWNSPFISLGSLLINDGSHSPNYLVMKVFGIPAKIAVFMGDLLVFNNERLAHYVLGSSYKKYKHKVVIAPYGHEGVLSHKVQIRKNTFILAHVGQIYGNRTLNVLLEAIKYLKTNNPELYMKLEIQQIGFICNTERKKIICSDVSDRFRLIKEVTYDESIRRMYLADCLLIIDPIFKKSGCNIYVPVKIFDYMSTGLPIASIADNDSATADIINKIKGILVPHDAVAVYKMLEQLLKDSMSAPDLQAYEKFHCKYGAGKLDKAYEKLFS